MTHEQFRKLLDGGETEKVDFKIECLAFQPRSSESEAAKAELAKDVCAMANNRGRQSFLIVGVADNGRDFKSVSNPGLTDENLQTFFREAVSPPPRVRVSSFELPASTEKHSGKKCVIITIGPHANQVFRLNRDFISPHSAATQERYHFRRNEVWIRRGSTSDLASPEEVTALSERGRINGQESRPGPRPGRIRGLVNQIFSGSASTSAEVVARRFLTLFNEHGVADTQIQQFLSEITLDKIHRPEALMQTLTPEILDRAADLFHVRREWLDGVDDRIYDFWSCYKFPENFFEELGRINQDGDSFPVRALYTGQPLDRTADRCQPLALLMVEKIRDLGEVEVCS